jgi:predicted nucleic acid-binding protein
VIILDTNVVSEPLKPKPDAAVLSWLDRQAPEALYLTTISVAELLDGIERLPSGRRRTALGQAITGGVLALFNDRLLSFDRPAAEAFALLNSRARNDGLTIGFGDCQIAAIAAARGFMVATRDVAPFRAAGIQTIDPWQTSSG